MINRTVEGAIQLESEYSLNITALSHAGILSKLPRSGTFGVVGIDGREYPAPTLGQVAELFSRNKELVGRKVSQGFDRLELTPLALPMSFFIDRMEKVIIEHAAAGKIYQTKRTPSASLIPVRVNAEKHVWIWETLKQALDADELIYFPQEYSNYHQGQTKLGVVDNERICAVPGWSVELVENLPIMPQFGEGLILGGRKQLEVGFSPREYLQVLQTPFYRGETGKTLEDFITSFLIRLETANEVSNDVDDSNALWCLGQYLKISYAEVVPTGRWVRKVGRVRLDMHRTGNKLCTKDWGGSTVVRLPRP
ncbi:MAG: hypothetical protein WC921_03695 [Candidatus Paceibacterota bacterium]|jgi:hypothetical protein